MSVSVSFKEEAHDDLGRQIGPVIMIDHDLYDNDPEIVKSRRESVGLPYGYKPRGMSDLGWLTRNQALTIARRHGVTLTEW